jgi:diaminopropionate ammonia-lyase
VFVKLESERPLGNFKVLGGMVAALRALARVAVGQSEAPLPRLICASDGNHGLAVAAAAKRAGAPASIHLPIGVDTRRARRIEALGASIVWIDGTYDDAVDHAVATAARGEGILIPDTSTDAGNAVVRDVMAGYALLTRELVVQFREEMNDRPSHVFVQAGVGGLAAAMAEGLRDLLQSPARLLVVEPEAAACVAAALVAGHPVRIAGELRTVADMLSCGVASAPALRVLQRHHARSILVDEALLRAAVGVLREAGGPDTTPSGAAGLAGLLHAAALPALRAEHQLHADSTVLLVVTEGPTSD